MCRGISRDFFLADHILPTHPEPGWQKMAQFPLNGTTKPVENWKSGRKAEAQPWTDNG